MPTTQTWGITATFAWLPHTERINAQKGRHQRVILDTRGQEKVAKARDLAKETEVARATIEKQDAERHIQIESEVET